VDLTLEAVSVLTIATNRYLEYWKAQATSIDLHAKPGSKMKIYLFTDQVMAAKSFSSELRNVSVEIEEIPNYGWPEATLLRYRIISESRFKWDSDEVLIYLDADMEVVSPLHPSDFYEPAKAGICLVRHPGYYRPAGKDLWFLYLANPKLLLGDLWLFAKEGGLGYWETRKGSKAFVPRGDRRTYFCGGIWWGRARDLLPMVSDLARGVQSDLERDLIAKWHDESHLNAWSTRNPHQIQSPSFCFVPGYKWLDLVPAKIRAVEKGPVDRI